MFVLKSTHEAAVAAFTVERAEMQALVDKLTNDLWAERARSRMLSAKLNAFTGPRERASNGRFQRSGRL